MVYYFLRGANHGGFTREAQNALYHGIFVGKVGGIMKKIRYLLSLLVLVLSMLTGCSIEAGQSSDVEQQSTFQEISVERDGEYTSRDEVAAYLHQYGELPKNFITKKQAKQMGWVSSEGNLHEVAPGKSIGGDYFGNYEGILPEKKGREYHECDIDADGSYRGAKRIIYSDDGLIYYTEDHYETFELLYGAE